MTGQLIETPLGPLPHGWPLRPLAELLEFRNGVNAAKASYGRGTRFINVLEVITKSHLKATDIPGRIALTSTMSESFAVRRGDIVFNRTSETPDEVGLAAVYVDSEPVVFGGFVIRARPRTGVQLNFRFAGYALRAPAVRQQVTIRGQGAIRANIGQSDLNRVLLPMPPLREQGAIADALDELGEQLCRLDELIAKKEAVKQGVMQQLLTGQTRLPGFNEPWRPLTVAELGKFNKGRGIRKDDVSETGIPCVRYGEIYTRHHDVIRTFHSFIARDVAATSHRLAPGDIIFAASGETAVEIGKCVAFLGAEEAYVGSDTVVLSPAGHDSTFLSRLLNTPSVAAQKTRYGQGDAVVHISARNLGRVQVSVPPLVEQRAIAEVLTDMDAEFEALKARRDKTQALKQGMMQELLSGRIRLV